MAICGTFFAVSQVGLVVYLVDHRLVTTVYFEVPLPILPQQALLYRLWGDRNPLAALGSGVCCCSGLSAPDSARPVHVRGCVQGDRGQRARWRRELGAFLRCPVAGVVGPRRDAARQHLERRRQAAGPITAPSRDDATVLSGVELTQV